MSDRSINKKKMKKVLTMTFLIISLVGNCQKRFIEEAIKRGYTSNRCYEVKEKINYNDFKNWYAKNKIKYYLIDIKTENIIKFDSEVNYVTWFAFIPYAEIPDYQSFQKRLASDKAHQEQQQQLDKFFDGFMTIGTAAFIAATAVSVSNSPDKSSVKNNSPTDENQTDENSKNSKTTVKGVYRNNSGHYTVQFNNKPDLIVSINYSADLDYFEKYLMQWNVGGKDYKYNFYYCKKNCGLGGPNKGGWYGDSSNLPTNTSYLCEMKSENTDYPKLIKWYVEVNYLGLRKFIWDNP